jgi:alkanesulfonate monooxygenase
MLNRQIKVFSTSPQSKDCAREEYSANVVQVARWSEELGCEGILVYTDNSIVDPWLVSQIVLQNTNSICPLVAVQPAYMHPYTAAKMVASLGHLHNRRMYLNMVAGGFRNDLLALNDTTEHDDRYARTVEYGLIMKQLLAGPAPVTFEGRYYRVKNLKMTPPLAEGLAPGFLISGSSPAGMSAAKAIGATSVKYPKPPEEEQPRPDEGIECGIRVGIIARDHAEDAWRVARVRFPEDRRGQFAHQLAVKTSDSHWHQQLSEPRAGVDDNPYWLGPMQNYQTFCPYLVGSYDRTAEEITRYLSLGYRTFILDIPASLEELESISVVFDRAQRGVAHGLEPAASSPQFVT